MDTRTALETDILIRLTEDGFIATTRRLGSPETILFYETAGTEATLDCPSEERLAFVRPWRNQGAR